MEQKTGLSKISLKGVPIVAGKKTTLRNTKLWKISVCTYK